VDVQRAILTFEHPDALAWLERAGDDAFDALDLGVIAMDSAGIVVAYNSTECRDSGLSKERVIGRRFFDDVAACMNNFMVSERYAVEPELDETIAYVFTMKMRPRRVQLRLLKSAVAVRQYMLVKTLSK